MRILVIGAGGHAKVVIDAIEASGDEVAAVVDEAKAAASLLGHPVLAQAPSTAGSFVVAIGDNAVRKALFEHYRTAGLEPATVVHPSATIASGASIGAGSVVLAGVVVNRDAVVGENAILNTGCTVDHDCSIGDHAHIAPGANLCGGVTVGQGTLVGVGACAIPGATIGAWSTVGAGAAVVGPVADAVTVVAAHAVRR
jgi:sugar O-acyltransferase (sialic acid O-acetyltransferase NeuD family)